MMEASSERIMEPGFQVSEPGFWYRGIPRNKAFISRNQASGNRTFLGKRGWGKNRLQFVGRITTV